jgi:MoaA/NifB/PqqE/SkfB family radical SAM enzyme
MIHVLNIYRQTKTYTDKLCRRFWLFIGTQCKISCSFCYYNKERRYWLALDQLKQISSRFLSVYNFTSVDISGGEPLDYPFLEDLISYLHDLQLQVGIVTNGLNVTRLSKLLDDLDDILVTFHGFSDVYQLTTGKHENFKLVLETINLLEDYHFPFRINCVLFGQHESYISDVLDFLNEFSYLKQVNLLPINSWASRKDEIFIRRYIYDYWSFDNKQYHFELNVRYLPYCLAPLSINVPMYLHIWDKHDWSPISYTIKNLDVKQKMTDQQFLFQNLLYVNKRLSRSHFKFPECKQCKFYYICDGFQQAYKRVSIYLREKIQVQEGEYEYNPLKFRRCPGDF